jgi:hypothetical protein
MILHQPALLHRRADERGKQRVRRKRPRFQLGVELRADDIYALLSLYRSTSPVALEK